MKKLLIGTALIFAALPFTFDGVTPTVSKAHAIIGRPLTPFSVAGVHRRAMRRTYGLGWRGGVGYGHYGYGYRHPVAAAAIYRHRHFAYGYHPLARRAAVVGAAAYGTGWGGGWGGWGWQRPWRPGLYAYAGAAPGWGGGWGWGRGWGWGGGWGGWGWRRW